jgi:hypothetical protein
MATLSHQTSQYRDGVFSAASPAPRYGQLTAAFENGSLGDATLEDEANSVLDPALDRLVAALQPAGLESRALPPAAVASAQTAISFAQLARAESDDIPRKIQLAMAASYAAAFFGLPRNNLLYVIDQVCGMFALTAAQRRDYHAQAAALLDNYVRSIKKGNAMSGAFRDGSLGILQNGAFRDGTLGAAMLQNGAFHDGSLGAIPDPRTAAMHKRWQRYRPHQRVWTMARTPQLRGLGGCGCSGVGDDAVATETPFYKKPLYIGGAAVVLGAVIYAISKR